MKSGNESYRLVKPFVRGLPLIAISVLCGVLLVKRYLKYATPIYESTAKIRLADTKDGSTSSNLYKDFDVFTNANKIGAELEVIKSKVLLNRALDSLHFDVSLFRVGQIRKLELYDESPFMVTAKLATDSIYDKVVELDLLSGGGFTLVVPGHPMLKGDAGIPLVLGRDTLVIDLNKPLLLQRPGLKVPDHYEFIIHSREKLIDKVIASMEVTSVDKEIPVMRITFKSAVARKSADFVNGLAHAYIDDYIDTKFRSANTTVRFLDDRLKDEAGRLSASESAIESYRDKNGIINIRQQTETDLRKIADMKVQQTNVRMNLEAIEGLYQYMRQGHDRPLDLAPNFEAYTDLLATEMVKKMKMLQAEKKDLLLKYTPEHEAVMAVDGKLKDIATYLEEGINNTRKNLQVKYDRLASDISEAEQVFNGLPGRERTMGVLNRNFMQNEQTFNFLHEKRTEAQIARAANISFHRIISSADVPKEPVSPNGPLLKILGAFLGFLFSVGLIYMVHALKGKVNDEVTIEKNSTIPIAAATPFLLRSSDILTHFHKLSIQLELKGLLEPNKILAISSFDPFEGKSFNAMNLALELVAQQKRVLLVDVDGSMRKKGIVDGAAGFVYEDLSLIGGFFTNSQSMAEHANRWRMVYDHVIIRNESLHTAANGLMMMKLADANLFLMDSRRTPASLVAEAELFQQEYHYNNMRFLLNRAGYNPNLIHQLISIVRNRFNRSKPGHV